jgi:hypothetical protein
MGHSEHDPAAKDRRPWNAGRKLGAKRTLKPRRSGLSGSGWIESTGYATARCSISRSTVSVEGVTSSKSRACQRQPGSLTSDRHSAEDRLAPRPQRRGAPYLGWLN